MRKFFYALILLAFSCSEKTEEKDISKFLKSWSEAMSSGEEQKIRSFFEPTFPLPEILWKISEGVSFSLDVVNSRIKETSRNSWSAKIPYSIKLSVENSNFTDTVEINVIWSSNNWKILEMSKELISDIKNSETRALYYANENEVYSKYDSLVKAIQSKAQELKKNYDSVVFFTEVENKLLFYVVMGQWSYPYAHGKQSDQGAYRIGIVTSDNQVIVPVVFDKVYNPNGSFAGMIEVERDGKRGLFKTNGEEFLPAEYDGIYPYSGNGIFAQIKQGEKYGWINSSGKPNFDNDSHVDKNLFRSPVESKSITKWRFKYPGSVSVIYDIYPEYPEEANGIIIYPSYLRDLGITDAANSFVMSSYFSQFGMGMEENEIGIEKVESFSGKLFSIVSFFMESGADARGYHFKNNDLIVVNQMADTISSKRRIVANDLGYRSPCSEETYTIIDSSLVEIRYNLARWNDETIPYQRQTAYRYYRIDDNGKINQLESDREYAFTQFVKLDKSYFAACNVNPIEYEDAGLIGSRPNMVINTTLTYEELDVMRNEIFATYGYKFKSEKWKKYFEGKSWYKPQYDDVNQLLNEIDKYNAQFILNYQQKNKNLKVERDSVTYYAAG